MTMLPKNACAYPFKAAMLQHGVPATPCCRFHDRFLDSSDKESINTYSATFADIRDTMMRNEWHAGCYKCRADEESKGSSMRTEANEFFKDFDDVARLEYLEITVGRLCNLACVTCGPEFSHTWDKDAIALGMESQEKITRLQQKQEYDLRDLNLDNLKYLRNIKVTGGEPFLHRQFLEFIVKLADSGLAQQINIEIFTNCTWWPAKVEYDALAKFKRIRICPSIDGYGITNDIVRYPSKFSKIEQTLDQWIAFRDEFNAVEKDKVTIASATTVNVLNAPAMFEYMHWARVNKGIDVVLQSVYEPNYLSIIHWPQWYKRTLAFVADAQFDNFNNKRGRYVAAHRLIKKLCATPTASNEDNSKEYLIKIQQLLEHRGQSIEDMPHFARILKYNDR